MNLNTLFSNFKSKKVLIIGDAMIDTYMWGEINRISPEAPVPVVEVKEHESRLGGAANVALNIQALGATPILCSVIGEDNQANQFQKLMQQSKLSNEGILTSKNRRTTIKTRIIAKNKHQLRVDEEDTKPIDIEEDFIARIKKLIDDSDVVILQDYNKGTLTPMIIREVIKISNTKNIPTIVDPKKENFKCYDRCTIFKPNLLEIQAGMGVNFNADNISDIERFSEKLLNKISARGILLTLSERGISIKSKELFKHTPAFERNVIDVSGAGDTVISVAALCLAEDIDLIDLSKLSSLAGGIVCESVGVVPIKKDKLLSEARKHII